MRTDGHAPTLSLEPVLDILGAAAAREPEAALADVLELVREAAGCDVASILRTVDRVTAEALITLPGRALPDWVTSPAIFGNALESERPHYRAPSEEVAAIPRSLRGTTAIFPWPGARGGALVLVRHRDQPFSDSEKRFLELTSGLVLRLAELCHERARADELKSRFNAIVHTLPHALVFMNENGRDAWVNHAAGQLLGLEQGLVPPYELAMAMGRLRTRARDTSTIEEFVTTIQRDPDAEIRDALWFLDRPALQVLSVSSTPTWTRSTRGRLWLFIDITDQHLASEALAENFG